MAEGRSAPKLSRLRGRYVELFNRRDRIARPAPGRGQVAVTIDRRCAMHLVR